jgi:hypothetical protein
VIRPPKEGHITSRFLVKNIVSGPLPRSWEVFAYALTFIVAVAMLAYLVLVVPVLCGRVIVESNGEYACDIWTGWYIFTGAFVIIAVYAGYNLYLRRQGITAVNKG